MEVTAVEAPLRAAAQAARGAAAAHEGNTFIDELEAGPRNAP